MKKHNGLYQQDMTDIEAAVIAITRALNVKDVKARTAVYSYLNMAVSAEYQYQAVQDQVPVGTKTRLGETV